MVWGGEGLSFFRDGGGQAFIGDSLLPLSPQADMVTPVTHPNLYSEMQKVSPEHVIGILGLYDVAIKAIDAGFMLILWFIKMNLNISDVK